MSGAKLDYTRRAVKFTLEHLEAEDIVSIVTFDNEVNVLVPAQKVDHKDQAIQALSRVRAGGMTNLSGGLFKGASLVRENLSENRINRVVLLTDGLANVGITDPQELVSRVRGLKSKGISVVISNSSTMMFRKIYQRLNLMWM
jgi:Ca-activated chloride channel family protein